MTRSAGVRGVIAALVVGGLMGPGLAQVQVDAGGPPAEHERQSTALPQGTVVPTPMVSMAVFNVVEQWVRAWDTAGEVKLPPEVSGSGACMVTLRLERRVIGRGSSFEGGAAGVVGAVRAAMADAETRMEVVRDATESQQRREIAARIAVGVEVAGALVPLVAETYGEVDSVLEPGLDGVAARVKGVTAGVFPSEMMLTNRPPSDGVVAAMSAASGDATLAVKTDPKGQPGELVKDGKATFQKFRVMHVVQLDAKSSPAFVFRGGRVVQGREVTAASMRAFADQLAANLVARVDWASDDRAMVGTTMPFQGRRLGSATAVERMIACAALARHAQGLEGAAKAERIERVRELLSAGVEGALRGPVESAAWVIAAREVSLAAGAGVENTEMARVGARLASAFDVDTGWSGEVPEGARGFVAFALVLEARGEGLGEEERATRVAKAEKCVRAVFEATPPARLVGQMPWLGKAELELARATGGEVKAAAALMGVREMVWKHQLTSEDSRGEADDLIGGIVFTTSVNPLPTAQSVRPLMLLAEMARDRRVTSEEESLRELSRLLAGVRFLRQLSVDEWAGHACPDASMLWGVRSSLWDQRQPAEATALTLWCVCEVLEGVGGR